MGLNVNVHIPLVVSDNTVLRQNPVRGSGLPALEDDVDSRWYTMNQLQQAVEHIEANNWIETPRQHPFGLGRSQNRTNTGGDRFSQSFDPSASPRNAQVTGRSADVTGNIPFGHNRNPGQSHEDLYPQGMYPQGMYPHDLRGPASYLNDFTNPNLGLGNNQRDGQLARSAEELNRLGRASKTNTQPGFAGFYRHPPEISGAYQSTTSYPPVSGPHEVASRDIPSIACPSRLLVPGDPTPASNYEGNGMLHNQSLLGLPFNHLHPSTRTPRKVDRTTSLGVQDAQSNAHPTNSRAHAGPDTHLADSKSGDEDPYLRELLDHLRRLRILRQLSKAKPLNSQEQKRDDRYVRFDHCCCHIGTYTVHRNAHENGDRTSIGSSDEENFREL
jgi:hypothetical protein